MILLCLNYVILGYVKQFRRAAPREQKPVPSQVDPALAILSDKDTC